MNLFVIIFNFSQIIQAATTFYKKLEICDSYKPHLKVNCEVTLVKPTENYAKLEEDYGLHEVRINLTYFLYEFIQF